MQTIIRSQLILTVGLLALSWMPQPSRAQSCSPGVGITTKDLLFGVWGQPAPPPVTDFLNSSTGIVNPTAIQPVAVNEFWVIENGGLVSVAYNTVPSPELVVTKFPAISGATGMAWDGTNLWIVTSAGALWERTPGAAVTQIASVGANAGKMIFDGTYLWIVHSTGALTRALLNSGAAPTITQIQLISGITALTYDGQYLWVAAPTQVNDSNNNLFKIDAAAGTIAGTYLLTALPAPKAMLFDGYSLWIADGSEVARINAGTGARSGSYPASGAESLTFDGTQIWVAEESSNSIVPIRACDGEFIVKSIATPASPVAVAFDGAKLWVASSTAISLR